MKDYLGNNLANGVCVAHARRTSTQAYIQPAVVLSTFKRNRWGRDEECVQVQSLGSTRSGVTFPDRLIVIDPAVLKQQDYKSLQDTLLKFNAAKKASLAY